MKEIRPDLTKEIAQLCNDAWQSEIKNAKWTFSPTVPDFSDWRMASKRAEAILEWEAKSDQAKLRKLALLKAMAAAISEMPSAIDTELDKAEESLSVINFL